MEEMPTLIGKKRTVGVHRFSLEQSVENGPIAPFDTVSYHIDMQQD
jgi:hypothetical protein